MPQRHSVSLRRVRNLSLCFHSSPIAFNGKMNFSRIKRYFWRNYNSNRFYFVLSILSTVYLLIRLLPLVLPERNEAECDCARREQLKTDDDSAVSLAVIVPFRDRFDELLEFVPHMTAFLNRQGISHRFYIVNQQDNYRFNRGLLINVGFLLARQQCQYFVMHDVDLLPLNDELSYGMPPPTGSFHISAPNLHPKYHYDKFVGGVLVMRKQHFLQVNGFSNNYWGWGLEGLFCFCF